VTLNFDLLTLKVVSESRVTWATSVLVLVFLVLDLGPMYATDRRQRDRRQTLDKSITYCPRLLGMGHNNLNMIAHYINLTYTNVCQHNITE